jgi:predicted kinase
MRATTCSGKGTFIKQHFKHDSAIFSPDKFREMMCGDIHTQQFNKQVFDTMHHMMDFRLSNRAEYTVYDATNLRIRDASAVIELSKKHGCPITVVSIHPPAIEDLFERNNARYMATGVLIPDSVIDKHYNRYFASMDPFLKEASYNRLMKFIEINQDYEVLREI